MLSHAYGLTSRTLPPSSSSRLPPRRLPLPPTPRTRRRRPIPRCRSRARRSGGSTPEELFRSLIVATGVDRLEQLDADKVRKRIERGLKEYSFIFADDEGAEVNTFNGNIPQALLLFNGELTNQGAKQRPARTWRAS